MSTPWNNGLPSQLTVGGTDYAIRSDYRAALDKMDQEWYRRSRHLVDFKRKYTQRDEDTLSPWLR